MKLRDALDHLSLGELSNLSISDSGSGDIKPGKLPMVINAMNEALIRLYTKLELKVENVFINPQANIASYVLDSKHAITNTDFPEEDKYIQDSEENPFIDDVIRIISVINSKGFRYPMNNPTKDWSIFTPSYNIILFPFPVEEDGLSIMYQAKHPKLYIKDLESQDILLSPSLEGAFYSYVAYLLYSNINTQEAVANSQKFFQNYQMIMEDVNAHDALSQTYAQENIKFKRRGFV